MVGGGIMGLAVTYWLARLGARVVLFEAGRLCAGATSRNAGIVLPAANRLEDPGLLAGLLEEEEIDAHYQRTGHLSLVTTGTVWEHVRREVTAAGRSGRVAALPVAECEERLGLRLRQDPPTVLGGRWLADGGLVDPVRLGHGLAAAAARRGATLVEDSPVQAVRAAGSQLVLGIGGETVRAGQVVLACAAGIRTLLPTLATVVQPVRGQVLATTPLPPVFGMGCAIDWGTVYWRQARNGAVVLGGCRARDPATEASAPDGLNPRIQEALTRFLRDRFAEFPPYRVARRWAGVMDGTRDGRPLAGPLLPGGRCWVLSGFGGHGIPPALGFGNALAQTVAGRTDRAALAPYAPQRFEELADVARQLESPLN